MATQTVSSRTWTFGGRTYQQSELTIDGEAQLIQLVATTVKHLAENDFPFAKIDDITDDDDNVNMVAVADLLSAVIGYVPALAVDSALIMLGVFPTDEYGKPNADFAENQALVRAELKFPTWLDMVQTFMAQNDYERMVRPFVDQLLKTASAMIASKKEKTASSLSDEVGTEPSTT